MIRFGLDKAASPPHDKDAPGDSLCEFEHRVSKHSTDLGHVTVDPFRIVLNQDAQPVKQKPYRHSPVLAAKVRTEIDKLLLTGILRRSYSDWASPLVVVAKSNERIRLTCNNKKINEQSTIPVFPLPVVYISSKLGNSRVFSTTDLVSGFFQCVIGKDSIPLTVVCTQDGLWEWTAMPLGLAYSPGWFQSIMLRLCEGLEREKLFIDDIVCFSKTGNSTSATCDGSSNG